MMNPKKKEIVQYQELVLEIHPPEQHIPEPNFKNPSSSLKTNIIDDALTDSYVDHNVL